MSNCTGCGGVIGRDCFNPIECNQISNQQQQQDYYAHQRIQELEELLYEVLTQALCDPNYKFSDKAAAFIARKSPKATNEEEDYLPFT